MIRTAVGAGGRDGTDDLLIALRAKDPEARTTFFADQDGIKEKAGFRTGIVKVHEAATAVVGGSASRSGSGASF